ncbi:MAG: 30S ribosomal protein S21 [Alphaproteobacteria bacterium]|nr:30S ribosomal protein S21 [Alphaproteobacteria bacterium]
MVTIVVHDNNVEQALRVLKKKMQRDGSFRELKLRRYYEKPSEKKLRKKEESVRRARKAQRKRYQTEGF